MEVVDKIVQNGPEYRSWDTRPKGRCLLNPFADSPSLECTFHKLCIHSFYFSLWCVAMSHTKWIVCPSVPNCKCDVPELHTGVVHAAVQSHVHAQLAWFTMSIPSVERLIRIAFAAHMTAHTYAQYTCKPPFFAPSSQWVLGDRFGINPWFVGGVKPFIEKSQNLIPVWTEWFLCGWLGQKNSGSLRISLGKRNAYTLIVAVSMYRPADVFFLDVLSVS